MVVSSVPVATQISRKLRIVNNNRGMNFSTTATTFLDLCT